MDNINRLLAAAVIAALMLASATVAVAHDDDDDDGSGTPSARTDAATSVTDRSATLTGEVEHKGNTTSFRFEYGPTTSYGQSTAAGALAADSPKKATVSAAIEGLTPGTRYHFRLSAWNANKKSTGGDRSFTTTAAVVMPPGPTPTPTPTPADPPAPSPTKPDPGVSDAKSPPTAKVAVPPSAAAAKPVLGTSMVVAPLQGAIKVKLPGSSGYVTLAAGDSVPVGTLVDTRRGTVNLTSSLSNGTTQSGQFRGALFQVRQARAGAGTTDLLLRGGNFANCPRAISRGARAAATAPRKSPTRRLWSSDKGGRFRTHGRNSVATVRGTSWITTDTCAGTRTRVTEGAVAVRDRRKRKTVLVRAGGSYLARSAR